MAKIYIPLAILLIWGSPQGLWAREISLTRITNTDGSNFKSRLDSNSKFLVIGQSATEEILAFRLADLKLVFGSAHEGKVLSIQVTETGWLAACTKSGSEILVTSLEDPMKTYRIDLEALPYEQYGYFSCTSVKLMESAPELSVLFSSPTNRSVFKVSLEGAIQKVFRPFRGTWALEYIHNRVFALVNGGHPLDTMPVVFDYQTSETILGDGMGLPKDPKQRITTGYFLDLFVDRDSQSVFYLQPTAQRIVRLDVANPQLENFESKIAVSVNYPTAVHRLGRCLLVLGTGPTQDPKKEPVLWSILDQDPKMQWKESLVSAALEHEWTSGAMRQTISSAGDLFVAGWNGVTKVDSKLVRSRCQL